MTLLRSFIVGLHIEGKPEDLVKVNYYDTGSISFANIAKSNAGKEAADTLIENFRTDGLVKSNAELETFSVMPEQALDFIEELSKRGNPYFIVKEDSPMN